MENTMDKKKESSQFSSIVQRQALKSTIQSKEDNGSIGDQVVQAENEADEEESKEEDKA